MADRLLRWFTFTVFFGLLPLLALVTVHGLRGTLSWRVVEGSPELLFLAIMICATGIDDGTSVSTEMFSSWQITALKVLVRILTVGIAYTAILYGFFILDSVAQAPTPMFQGRLLSLTIWAVVVFMAVGTTIQIYAGYSEDHK